MKKLKLKKWVKVSLLIIGVSAIIALGNNFTKKSIDKCVASGNSLNYCESGLR